MQVWLRKPWRAVVFALSACVVTLVTVKLASASSPAGVSAHVPATVRAGSIGELQVDVLWTGSFPITSLVRVDGVPGLSGRQFGPNGYESRLFCDDDNPAAVVATTRSSVVWATGGLWHGAACEVRLFFIPSRPGRYVARVHFLTGRNYRTLLRHAFAMQGEEIDVPITVRPRPQFPGA